MKIIPWFRCKCGKLHTANFVNSTSKCKCGRKLYDQIPVRSVLSKPGDW